jgi:F-type H+/Na+-transporting ATPase subunit alpha
MEIKTTDLVSFFENALKDIPEDTLEEIGIVIQVGDNICKVQGLYNVLLNEFLSFEGGNAGMAFQLNDDSVSVFLLYNTIPVQELEVVKRTGSLFKVPVGTHLLGRVINALGMPIDGLGPIVEDEFRTIEPVIPGIIERSPVNEPLETGIFAIDTLIPIGKGQRELLIGNRGTGKTSIALDTVLHQKEKKVVCVYVAIGLRQAHVANTIKLLEENDALSYTVIVNAQAGQAVLNQYLAPYVGCTVAEYFRDQGRDVLIIYDDLSNHAIAFREMSLLLRRAPGREAYPGDVFYLHSRLLERAGKLKKGGSITALPIVQIQGDDITAYIPTNLISITDGQIFLDTQRFNQGIRPAVNVELSVSRVGGAAQTKAIKKMTRALKLELAQYNELAAFAQFGTELDEFAQRQLTRGKIIIELFKQAEHELYSFVDQTLMLFLLRESIFETIPSDQVPLFARQFASFVQFVYRSVYETIEKSQDISPEIMQQLNQIAQEFSSIFVGD